MSSGMKILTHGSFYWMSSSIRVDLAQHLFSLPSPPLVLSIYFTAHCGEHYLASKFEPTAHSVQCPLKITVSVAHHITVSVAHHTTVSVAHPIFCYLGLRSFCLSIPPSLCLMFSGVKELTYYSFSVASSGINILAPCSFCLMSSSIWVFLAQTLLILFI